MPPSGMGRKRKVQQALPAIDEDAEAGTSKPQEKKDADDEMPNTKESEDAQVHAIVKECKEQVAAKAEALIESARQRVQSLRAEAEAAISKLPKQLRQTSAAEFFALAPEEANGSILYHAVPRLQALQLGNGDPKAVEAAGLVASSLAAMAAAAAARQRVDAAAPVGPSAASQDEARHQQQTEPRRDMEEHQAQQQQPVKQQVAQHQQQTEPQQHHPPVPPQEPFGKADPMASAGSPSKLAAASALMPPPPPRVPLAVVNPPVRQPLANEMVLYSANGSPVHLSQLVAPATTAKGIIPSLTDATPAVGASSCAVVPHTMGFTGRTFRRAAPTRGRTKQPTRAITVTTQDGKQFTVDDLIGLAGVPQAYREEVRRLVESDHQDLSALVQSMTALEHNNVSTSAVPSGSGSASVPATTNSRPTRRR